MSRDLRHLSPGVPADPALVPSRAGAGEVVLAGAPPRVPRRGRHRTMAQLAWARFRRHRMALAGLCLVAAFALGAAGARVISPYDPRGRISTTGWPRRAGGTRWGRTTWG